MALISLRSLGLMWSAIAVAVVLAAAPGHAQSALTTSFNHFSTGFPLTGAHSGVDCASCHVNGRFKGTPKQCFACHNGTNAQGKSPKHPQTTNFCEGCHLTAAWRTLPFIDHVQATAPCATCHNGTIALGKPANHIVTAAPCGSCHRSTVSYAGATSFNHVGITTDCASCHNGVAALGRPANHVPTTAPCETCHRSTTTWAGGTFTHAATDTNCSNCHNGTAAIGLQTPPHIPVTGRPVQQLPHQHGSKLHHLHDEPRGGERRAAATPATTVRSPARAPRARMGTASYPGHVATNGRDCVSCHASAVSAASPAGPAARFAHAATDTNCSSCHNGTTATGLKTPPHIPGPGRSSAATATPTRRRASPPTR